MQNFSPSQAALELLARRKARAGLLAFTEFTKPDYAAAPHHRLIADKLEAVERGDTPRLMIFMPPRHGKSELASRRFPAWWLGRKPTSEVIAASYNSELAADFGREVRAIVDDADYRALFPISLRQDSQAADRWHTDAGGAYRASGVGTAMTGRGADLLLIDDPVKDREEADSELRRNRVWDWYRSTAYTRLSPGGVVVLIQTRWHEDDLAGRILAEMERGGEHWEVLDLPAILPTGEALWGDRFPLARLEAIKRTIGPRDWSALYMQRPQPDEGTFFQRDWFQTWTARPTHLRIYGTSDYAVTADGGDYTVHRVWGVDPQGGLYRLDGWRGQATSDVWIERKLDLVARYKPVAWFSGAGVIQKAVEPALKRRMREREVFCRLEWLPDIADKPSKARGFQARCAMGRVWFEAGADLGEFLTFPAGKHDDEVDAAGFMGMALDQAHPAIVSADEKRKNQDRDYRGIRPEQEEDAWLRA